MLKHLYKTAFFLAVGFLSLQNSNAQCPSDNISVSNDTTCSNASFTDIQLTNTTLGAKYTFYVNSITIDSLVATTGGITSKIIPLQKLSIGKNTISINASKTGCPTVTLKDTGIVVVNQAPKINLQVIGDTICDNASFATVTILKANVEVSYQAYIGTNRIGATIIGNGGDILLIIPRSSLSLGINNVTISASVTGCGTVVLVQKAIIFVNPIPMSANLMVKGDTICSNNPFAKITITPSSKSLIYQIFSGTMALTDPFYGDSTKEFTVKKIPTEELSIGLNLIRVETNLNMGVCGGIVSLKAIATIVIHPAPEPPTLKLTGDTVFVTEKFAVVKIQDSPVWLEYSFHSSQMRDTSIVAMKPTVELKIPVGAPRGLPVGVHKIFLNATIAGCINLSIRDSVTIVVKKDPTLSNENYFVNSNFSVWPNPFSSELHVSSKLTGNVNVQIVDALGNVMHQQTVSANEEIKINPELKNGLYFLQMESEGKMELVKLIKQ